MKIEPVRGPKFAALVKKYGAGSPAFDTPVLAGLEPNDPLALLLTNYLLWESTPQLAKDALERIARVVVDVNDLRVMLEREVIETIGEKYPFVEERAQRLRATLNDVFRRQHRTSLDHLRNASRKDQRAYLEGLAEIPPFVSGRTLLVAFELPAAIADDTTVELLHQQGAVEPRATTLEVVQWIGKSHRIEELAKVHHALSQMASEAWSAAGKNGTKIRGAYLARHSGFRAVEEAEKRRVEEEKLAKVREAERAAEAKRLEELAREEERVRQKREAEEARVRAKAEREAARVAAIAERARKVAEREAARIEREKQRERDAIARAKAAEVAAARKQREREAAARKAEILRAKREKQAAALKAKREKLAAAKQKAAAAKAAKMAKARLAAEKKAAAKKTAAMKKAAKKAPKKAPKKASKKAASKKPPKTPSRKPSRKPSKKASRKPSKKPSKQSPKKPTSKKANSKKPAAARVRAQAKGRR